MKSDFVGINSTDLIFFAKQVISLKELVFYYYMKVCIVVKL